MAIVAGQVVFCVDVCPSVSQSVCLLLFLVYCVVWALLPEIKDSKTSFESRPQYHNNGEMWIAKNSRLDN